MCIIFKVSKYPEVKLSVDATDFNHTIQCYFITYGDFLNAVSRSIYQDEPFL